MRLSTTLLLSGLMIATSGCATKPRSSHNLGCQPCQTTTVTAQRCWCRSCRGNSSAAASSLQTIQPSDCGCQSCASVDAHAPITKFPVVPARPLARTASTSTASFGTAPSSTASSSTAPSSTAPSSTASTSTAPSKTFRQSETVSPKPTETKFQPVSTARPMTAPKVGPVNLPTEIRGELLKDDAPVFEGGSSFVAPPVPQTNRSAELPTNTNNDFTATSILAPQIIDEPIAEIDATPAMKSDHMTEFSDFDSTDLLWDFDSATATGFNQPLAPPAVDEAESAVEDLEVDLSPGQAIEKSQEAEPVAFDSTEDTASEASTATVIQSSMPKPVVLTARPVERHKLASQTIPQRPIPQRQDERVVASKVSASTEVPVPMSQGFGTTGSPMFRPLPQVTIAATPIPQPNVAPQCPPIRRLQAIPRVAADGRDDGRVTASIRRLDSNGLMMRSSAEVNVAVRSDEGQTDNSSHSSLLPMTELQTIER